LWWGTSLLAIVLVNECSGQSMYEYSPMYRPIGARMVAFADASSASAYDVTCIFSNPASLSFLRTSSIVVNHTRNWNLGLVTDNVAIPLALSQRHTVAFGVTVDHAGYINPHPDGGVKFYDYGFDVGYSATILPTLSVGLLGSGRILEVDGVSRAGGWLSFGVFYFPTPGISYGLRLHGPGTGLLYGVDPEYGEYVDDKLKMPKALEIAAEMKYPARAFEPVVVLALATETVLSYGQTFYKGGIEIRPWSFLAFRMGYADLDGIHSFRMGAAMKLGRLRLEYSIAPGPTEQRYDALSLSYAWGGR
jgi:hypothetical protein